MVLLELHVGPWKVVAPVAKAADGRLTCPVQTELLSLAADYSKSVSGLNELFKRIDYRGPMALGTSIFHYVDKNEKIYEFVKGDLRLFCFLAPNNSICVCSALRIKKGRKVDKSAVAASIRLRDEFLKSATDKNINFISDLVK